MKTTKQNIENELQELGASFLLKQKKAQKENAIDLTHITTAINSEVNASDKPSKIRRMTIYLSGIAASILFAVLIFQNIAGQEETVNENTATIQQQDILYYLEDEISYFSDDEILAMLDDYETTNLFDNTGISDSYLEEYFINELNEEIQLEELL